MNDLHIELIHQLFSEADQIDMPLWLQGGWAIDAKLNRITREHEDIDIAYPGDRNADFLAAMECVIGIQSHQPVSQLPAPPKCSETHRVDLHPGR